MTANELADKLEERSSNYTYHGHYNKEAATMLRQQAEEIEALKLFKEQMKTRKAMVKWLTEESE
jgi:hypothetical protein